MGQKEIPETAIGLIAKHINERNNKTYHIPVVGNTANPETPQIFEIIPFNEIDNTERKFYAIDGSVNSQEFYNGLCIGVYTAGYVCYKDGKQIRMNELDDPIILGRAYFPDNILITKEEHLYAIYDELLSLKPVSEMLGFFQDDINDIFPYKKEIICQNLSTLLAFSQEILEWALIYEIAKFDRTNAGDFILKDGTLKSLHVKQKYLAKLGKFINKKGIIIVGITKNSPIKMELSYTFKQIDDYLQNELKPKYPFTIKEPIRQKLCCWFEVSEPVLRAAYHSNTSTAMFIKKDIIGGRGFGIFCVARLDYVEKLQNYDWLVVDINIYDYIPGIEQHDLTRDVEKLNIIFKELTRLTQEHYILGYPYPLVEAHNFVTLKKDFKDEIIKRVKFSLYRDQRMDNIDIENLFLDIHDRF